MSNSYFIILIITQPSYRIRRQTAEFVIVPLVKQGDVRITICKPNAAAELSIFLLRIRKVPSSNLRPETGYPDYLCNVNIFGNFNNCLNFETGGNKTQTEGLD
jgi:hypothetical protein